MMSFFKKENKEDKERKKLEKKLIRDSTLLTSSSNNSNNGTSLASSLLLSSSSTSFSSLSNLNNTIPTNKTTCSSQNQDIMSLSSSYTHEDKMNSNNYSENLLTLPPPLPSNGPPPVAPKPKKGILKTMSKFGLGGNTNHSLVSSSATSISSMNETSSPKILRTSNTPSIEGQITNYSKRNSQFVNDLPNFNTNSIASSASVITTTTTTQNVKVERLNTFSLPPLKNIPMYLTNINDLNNDEHCLMRVIQLDDPNFLSTVYLEKIEMSISGIVSSVFLIDNPKRVNYLNIFLPGDQLISINGILVFDKSLNDVKNLLNSAVNSTEATLKVRTNLANSELIARNTSSGIIRMTTSHDSEIKSLKRAGSIRRKFENVSRIGSSLNESTLSLASTSSSSSTSPIARSTSTTNDDNYSTTRVPATSDQFGLNNVWLIHQNGYSQAKIFAKIIHKNELNGDVSQVKFKIRLDNGSLIEVNEENLEKANPSPQYDFCEDLSQLRWLNETSLLHVIRQRYFTLKLIYTYIGSQSLLSMKHNEEPWNKLTSISSVPYDDRIVSMFKGCKQEDMPPHIYAYTQTVYKNMLSSRKDQSIILMGHSGSGKTQNSKHILNYLFKIAASPAKPSNLTGSRLPIFNEIKLTAMFSILNAFGCIQTERNLESNLFLNVFLLEFNHAGQLASILLQLIVFDQTRLVYQSNLTESNFLIFYYMLYGADTETLSNEFQIDSLTDLIETNENSFFQSQNVQKMKQQAGTEFNLFKIKFKQILESFKILNFTNEEVKALFSILAAICHLGRAGACSVNSVSNHQKVFGQFQSANEAHKAANLLGITFSQLNEHVFSLNTHSNLSSTTNSNLRSRYGNLSNNGSSRVSPADVSSMHHTLSPIECLQGFCIGLYQECLNLITNFINRSFKPAAQLNPNMYYNNQSISNSMLLIDPPGFHYQSKTNSEVYASSYSDLLSNYLSERLQLMFFQINFINPIEKCAQEGLDIDLVEHIPESPSTLVNWFDKPPASNSIIHPRGPNSGENTNSNNTCGLLWLIEEQMYSDQKSSKTLMQKLIESDPKQNFLSVTNGNNFTIYHQYGQFPVEYNVDAWLEKFNKEFLTQRNALHLLQDSTKDSISASFSNSAAMSSQAAALNHHGVGITGNSSTTNPQIYLSSSSLETNNLNQVFNTSSSLKRQASVRKMLTLSKRKTFTINFKLQIDSIFDSMRRTKCNFVFCFLPEQNKLGETSQQAEFLDVPLVRSQLKAYQILASCRIYRQGFPEYMNFDEFQRRFSIFLSSETLPNQIILKNDDHKQACINLVSSFDLDASHYKIGNTQIFFKAGILAKLEDKRDQKINFLIIQLQTNCRRYLAIKLAEKKRVQYAAMKCIQRNIRISFALKKWKWWRLYTQLVPIINVQNNETILKQFKDELDETKKKNERLISEKNELKIINNQLENKLMNLQTEYVEERAANAGTIDLLEVETSERMRMERDLNELKPLYSDSLKKLEILETEMLELRLINTKKSIEQELERDDIDGLSTASASAQINNNIGLSNSNNLVSAISDGQFERLKRENESLKRQIKQEKENTNNLIQNERKFFESKLREKDDELLEIEKQGAIHKRKHQKLGEEMQDLQRLCEDSKVRNRELEKLQLKFDAEMALLRNKYESEKEIREKCERERDTTKYEIFTLKSELESQKIESTYHAEKNERLERDLKEYEHAASSNSGNANISGLHTGSSTDQFIKMKSQIREMEAKLKDQEEELDEQTVSIQQLEQNKLRLEMQAEKEKQKWTREIAEKESEMDDLRFHTQKKIKAIEMQLEEESEISSSLQREKRDLERKLRELTSNSNNNKRGASYFYNNDRLEINANYSEYFNKMKRQMLKYKTLAIDTQIQLEKLKENIPKQSIMRSLKAQLEDSEISKANALKTKQLLQVEINDLQQQLEDANIQKQNVEEQNLNLNRELNNLKSQLEEQERDADDILKKYQNHIQNYSLDSHRFIDLNNQIDLLTIENRILKEKIREHEEKINYYIDNYVEKSVVNKVESKIRDFECKLDLEVTHKTRFQNQLERVKQQYEKSLIDLDHILLREKKIEDSFKRSQRQNKETSEELGELKRKLIDLEETKKRLEQQNEILERELDSSKAENKVNQNRLEAFQNAFNSINNEDDDDYDDDEDENDEDGDDAHNDSQLYTKNEIDEFDEDYGEDLENSMSIHNY